MCNIKVENHEMRRPAQTNICGNYKYKLNGKMQKLDQIQKSNNRQPTRPPILGK